jgi:uncharacterized protein (DUF2267 family)
VSYPATLAHAVQQTQAWLKQVRDYADLADEQHALSVLRAVLHQLRDRLSPNEVFDLAAQLPLVVRGLYFEGYRPERVPEKIRTKRQFLNGVEAKLQPHRIVPDMAVRAVFATLASRCDSGEIADVIAQLPTELKALWPPNRAQDIRMGDPL